MSMKNQFIKSGISHVSLFGSYARWDANNWSDLDLLIELADDHTVTLGTLDDIEQLLQKKLLVNRVDFVTKKSLNPRLKKTIQKDITPIF